MRHDPSVLMARLMENLASFPSFTDMAAFEAAFPTVASQMRSRSVVLRVEGPVGQGRHYLLNPADGDVNFVIEGESDFVLDNELLVSLWLEDSHGRRVPSYRTIEGFAASRNPNIGHFAYVPTSEGAFRSLVSLHLEHGYGLRGFRILGLSERAKTIQISQVVVQQRNGETRYVGAKCWDSERRQGARGLVGRVVDGVYQNRVRVASTACRILGEDRGSKLIAYLGQLNRKI